MSKSTGNLVFVRDLLAVFDPMAIRLAVLSQHYRSTEWEWTDELLVEAADRLGEWRSAGASAGAGAGAGVGPAEEVRERLDDDLDVPGAISLIDDAAARGQGVSTSAALLGVLL